MQIVHNKFKKLSPRQERAERVRKIADYLLKKNQTQMNHEDNETEFNESLLTVMNHGTTVYKTVRITKMGNRYHFLRQEFKTLEDAKAAIDQMWKDINSKPFNQ